MSERSFRRAQERRAAAVRRREALLRRRRGVATGAAIGATAIFASSAHADAFQVNSLADDGDGFCATGNPCTLRDALTEANKDSGPSTITFADSVRGIIVLTRGELTVASESGELTVTGPGAQALTVSADGNSRIFDIADPSPVTLSGLTLTKGLTDGSGGAILDNNGRLIIVDSVISGSAAAGNGGGVFADGAVDLTRTTLSGNKSTRGNGGGLYAGGGLSVAASTISGNSADNGGGIELKYSGEISDSTLSGNNAAISGAGISVAALGPDERVTVARSTISGNTGAGGSFGGGVALASRMTFRPSPAAGGTFDLIDSTISGNAAGSGGGIAFGGAVPVTTRPESVLGLDNSTIVSNRATDQGGGLFLNPDESDGSAPTILVTSTIVAQNTAAGAAQDLFRTPADGPGGFDLSFSLVQTPAGAPVTQTPAGSNILGSDPQLGALADNGGPTRTHLPATGSPAIDKGDAPSRLLTDQRNQPRTADRGIRRFPGGDGTDIGAVELPAAAAAPAATPPAQSPGNSPNDAPPKVSFDAPAPHATLAASTPTVLRASASDDKGVAKVQFVDDERVICEDTAAPYTCSFQPTGVDVGKKTFVAIAVDTAKQTATALRTVKVARFSLLGLTIRTTPKNDPSSPFTFTTTGRLLLPPGVTRETGCHGRVAVQIKAGKKTISTRRVKVTQACTYTSKVSFTLPLRLRPRRLNVRAIFSGNETLNGRRSKRTSVHVG
jgi:CSLREA domain-containing protein